MSTPRRRIPQRAPFRPYHGQRPSWAFRLHEYGLWDPAGYAQYLYASAEEYTRGWSIETDAPARAAAGDPTTQTDVLLPYRFTYDLGALFQLACHPHAPADVTNRAAQTLASHGRTRLFEHPAITRQTLLQAIRQTTARSLVATECRRLHLQHPSLPPKQIQTLWDDTPDHRHNWYNHREDWRCRGALLSNPACPRSILHSVFDRPHRHHLHEWVAKNPRLTQDDQVRLYQDGNAQAQWVTVCRPDCPRAIIDLAITSPNSTMRAIAAEHPILSADDLDRLANDKALIVRSGVARHPHTAQETLAYLGRSQSPTLHTALLERADLPATLRVPLTLKTT